MTDFYKILNVGRGATLKEIKEAYRKLAIRLHPDVNPTNREEAEESFKKLNHAYQVLCDERKRREYDSKEMSGVRNRDTWDPKTVYSNKGRHSKQSHPISYPTKEQIDESIRVWNSWHYGENASYMDPFKQVKNNTANSGPRAKGADYFQRQYIKTLQKEREEYFRQQQAEKQRKQDAAVQNLQEKRERRQRGDSTSNMSNDNNNTSDCRVS
jgi:curved DNA-binding protein CbpA